MKFNPPLRNGSGLVKFPKYYPDNSYKNCIILELENNGIFDISINTVWINGRIKPNKVELGISETPHLIDGTNDNKFYDISEKYKISPKPNTKKIKELSKEDNNIIIHYGLRIFDNNSIEKVIIEYTYLGISFKYIEEL